MYVSKSWLLGLALLACAGAARAQDDLADYRTVDKAVTTKIAKAASTVNAQPGYLGIQFSTPTKGKTVVEGVASDSPAARAGFQVGDTIVEAAGLKAPSADQLRALLQTRSPGETIKMEVLRKDQKVTLEPTLIAVSRVMQMGKQKAVLGVQLGDPKENGGVPLAKVTADMPAAKAGLKEGDILLKIEGKAITTTFGVADALLDKKPGDLVTILATREGKEQTYKALLAAEPEGGGGFGKKGGGDGGWDARTATAWKKDVYRLAIVCVEFPDVKHNPAISPLDWENALFSKGTYTDKSVTGQKVYGSMNDYYQEQSFNHLRIKGKCFDFVEVSKKRADYAAATGAAKSAMLTEALDLLYKRDGKDCLKDFDGVFFLHAGGRVQTNRGGLFWPHRSSVTHQGKRWSYFIVGEGGPTMSNISVICHEFGHMLGLPDLYARPENPGSEGVGVWCAMSNQVGNGKPQHFSAWSKDQLGWIKPIVIDPTVKQKLILSPIEDSPNQCIKVLARPDGSEYFFLENRRKKGFDAELPAEGLLIWRVVQNRPILEESHGIDGPSGPRVFLNAVPYPSSANNAFTPYTTPSSRAQLGGGLPVHITNIRRLPDGRITFHIGYEFY
jgi:M6 family metalloprotease-like protein